ncbi:uncharacterized protein METZ01_LOCUS39647 [marine metagenome]|uniref:Uncharacterized protein n=1 Tax=marine metagenome TaxID=408172 RepID=A0A381RBR7_9ZZZZ
MKFKLNSGLDYFRVGHNYLNAELIFEKDIYDL